MSALPPPTMRARLLVYALFLSSGAIALVYQVVWIRSLTLIFGASYEAIAIVLGSFMAGLALGGVSFGRRASRIRHPLRLYGLLEIGIALAALALPFLFELLNRFYVGAAVRAEGVTPLLNGVRIVTAFAVLLLPTFFMGGTLPVLVQVLVSRYRDLAARLSGLYAINTLGAVIGTLCAGFVLLPGFGVRTTTLIAVVANLAIGIAAVALDRRSDPAREPAADAEPVEAGPLASALVAHPLPLRLAFWGTAVSGMGALALEVLWSRAISIAVGSTTYSATIMLATFLVGIAAGSALHAIVPLKRIDEALQFGVVLVCIGASSVVVSNVIPRLPELALRLNLHFYGGALGVRTETILILCFLVMLVPCLFMGAAFPLAGQARARLTQRFGESVGDLVGLNTSGAIVGSLLAGFVLIPLFGLHRGMLAAATLFLAYGLIVLGSVFLSRRPALSLATRLLGATPLVGILALPFLLSSWDPRRLAAFENNKTGIFLDPQGRLDIDQWLTKTKLLYNAEGRAATVTVVDSSGIQQILINGKSVATNNLFDMHHEYLLGHLPTLLHPHPRKAVVVGLGAGLTLGGVAAHDSFDEIVVVEIERAVLGGAQQFAELHDDALNDPRVRVVFQDGRNYLLTTAERFDVITADPIHPWAQGAAYLYTTQYYRMVRERLAQGGVMCQWLPMYELTEENLRSVIGSFADAFEYVSVWQASFDLLLVGSTNPLRLDLEDIAGRLKQPKVARQLARVGLDDPLSLLAEFVTDGEDLKRMGTGAVLNTDDNLYLEFSAPRAIGMPVVNGNLAYVDSFRANPAGRILASAADARTLERYQAAKAASLAATSRWYEASQQGTESAHRIAVEQCRKALALEPDYVRAQHVLSGCLSALALIRLPEHGYAGVKELLEEALALDPDNSAACFQTGANLVREGRLEEALTLLRRALDRQPYYPDARRNLAFTLASLGRLDEAIDEYTITARHRPWSAAVHHELGVRLVQAGRPEQAVEALERAYELAPNRARLLEDLQRARKLLEKR